MGVADARKRWHILADLIGVFGLERGAEIGVKSGANIDRVLKARPEFFWYAVDPWVLTTDYRKRARWTGPMVQRHEVEFDAVHERWPDNIEKVKAISPGAAERFADGSLDLVFIDGDHTYEGVRADIDAWLPKVRAGGIIAGHDFANSNKYGAAFDGIERAVRETFRRFHLDADHVWWCRV